jgi:hypothetical protein
MERGAEDESVRMHGLALTALSLSSKGLPSEATASCPMSSTLTATGSLFHFARYTCRGAAGCGAAAYLPNGATACSVHCLHASVHRPTPYPLHQRNQHEQTTAVTPTPLTFPKLPQSVRSFPFPFTLHAPGVLIRQWSSMEAGYQPFSYSRVFGVFLSSVPFLILLVIFNLFKPSQCSGHECLESMERLSWL